ncbi:glycosyltransferase family 4 protein [Mucilaginibacter auburnensis]|uniref:Glycosyltransferase involved in cell wall biosynthesis n=1 Tax=Mucilaginibacter auburnensis TaxID=1457233 RepID=A0A2H9VT89_9SPHI|nr:glycosyltransferase family 4 protein [Mucilaginibacter auburnensis]PJJ84053.1 glycosyltransferase involved in cell wall biosynthesis [Mucilaginibacter auburnensis]
MNILITAPSLDTTKNVSGVATVVNTIINNNPQQKYFHYLLGSPDKRLSKPAWAFELVRQLVAFPLFIRKNKIDIVHQNLPFDPKGLTREYFINRWCKLMGVPVLLHVHGGVFLMDKIKSPLYLKFANYVFKHSRKVVVLSDLEKETLGSLYNYYNANVLYNSINTKALKTENRRYDAGNPKFLFLGRIHESKGIEDIYHTFEKINDSVNFKFILCGTGPLESVMVPKFKALLGDKFEFKGIVSGKQKDDAIKGADFFLLPSRYGEGLPMALLECMAAGVVPIVTDDASMKFVIQDMENGIRVNKSDPDDIAQKIKNIIHDDALRAQLSSNVERTAIERYDISAYIVELNKLYADIAGNV